MIYVQRMNLIRRMKILPELLIRILLLSLEVNRRTWLNVPLGNHWSTSSDIHQVVEI